MLLFVLVYIPSKDTQNAHAQTRTHTVRAQPQLCVFQEAGCKNADRYPTVAAPIRKRVI